MIVFTYPSQTTTLTGAASETTLAAMNAKITACNTGAVVVSSSALPTGAATETTLSALNTKVPSNLTVKAASTAAVAADQALVVTLSPNNSAAVTQSGTWNITNVSGTVSLPTGAATSANQTTTNTNLTTINTSIGTTNTNLTTINTSIGTTNTSLTTTNASLSTVSSNTAKLAVVDLLDSNIIDTSSSNIAASASSPTQVVASTAAIVRKIVSVEDIGEFIGVYTGAAASEVLHCVLPLGGGEVQVNIPAGTRISLRNMKNAAISSGFIAINFLG